MTIRTMFRALTVVAITLCAVPVNAQADAPANAKLVKDAMTALFINRDPTAVDRYFGKTYTQHNPNVPNGVSALPDMIKGLPANFKYEPGIIVADDDHVAIHGRYTGFGAKPLIAIDIFRIEDGKLVEHWDVLQPEVPAGESANGNPMFASQP